MGLLTLRLALVLRLLADGRQWLTLDAPTLDLVTIVLAVTVAGAIVLVAVGFLTPLVTTIIAIATLGGAVAEWRTGQSPGATQGLLLTAIVATSMALIGPGAYSIDGRMFGRREITLPVKPPRVE